VREPGCRSNIFLGREPERAVVVLRAVDRARMLVESRRILSQLDIRIPRLTRQSGKCPAGSARRSPSPAVYWNAPTPDHGRAHRRLGVPEQRKVLAWSARCASGRWLIIISHNLQECSTSPTG